MIGIDDILLTIAPDAIKGVAASIPNAVNKARFKNFFGAPVIGGENVFIVLDPYEYAVSRSELSPGQARFVKRFHGRRADAPVIGEDKLLRSRTARMTKYAAEALSKFQAKEKGARIVLDEEVINLWDGSFFCFGSADCNIKTFDIENLPQNNLYTLGFDDGRHRCFVVNGETFSIAPRTDRGIIARFLNPYFTEHFLFICAGLGEWGTSGAAYFLFDQWRQLNARFRNRRNFCLVIEVETDSDQSAKEIRAYSP
jgi:hypothetical protein